MKPRTVIILAAVNFAGWGAIVYLAAATYGRGSRGFFSPDTLQSRSQQEYLIPLTDIPVYRSDYGESQWPIVGYLISKGYWSALDVDEPRWVSTYHENRQWRDGVSRFHYELVGNEAEWRRWTEAHPDLARVVWPRVLNELRKPGVMHPQNAQIVLMIAQYAKTPEEFEQLLSE